MLFAPETFAVEQRQQQQQQQKLDPRYAPGRTMISTKEGLALNSDVKDQVIERILGAEKILILIGSLVAEKRFSEAGVKAKALKKDMEKDMDTLSDLADAKMVQMEKQYIEKAGSAFFNAFEDLEFSIAREDAVGAALAQLRAVALYKKAIVGLA